MSYTLQNLTPRTSTPSSPFPEPLFQHSEQPCEDQQPQQRGALTETPPLTQNVKVVSASPCLLCFLVLSCAVLFCAVPCRVVPWPCSCTCVRLLILCISVTFRLSVRVSLPVCCGRYVYFSKTLTFHNGSTAYYFSLLFQALFETSSCTSFTNQVGLEI